MSEPQLPEVDWEGVFDAISALPDAEGDAYDNAVSVIREVIIQVQKDAWNVGRDAIYREGVTRSFLLDEKSRWLDQADAADGEVGRVVARFVATAFGEAADRLRRADRPTLDGLSTDADDVLQGVLRPLDED